MRAWKLGVGVCVAIACLAALVVGGGAPKAARAAATSVSRVPTAARAPISDAAGAGDRSFWVRDLSAVNRSQHLSFSFTRAGVAIRKGSRFARLSLAAFGRAGQLSPVSPAAPVTDENRVTYDRGAIHEWYANGPLGLEQGFELSQAPAGTGPLVLSLALGGDLRARMDGSSVLLGGASGLRYGDLAVTDASGRQLPASLGLAGSQLRISIDAAGARFPLRVDPVTQSAELSPPTGLGPAQFGTSVAISGNTIVVGDPSYDSSGGDDQIGAAFVFEQHAGAWDTTPDAVLTATDLNASSQLGSSVAISGDTIVAGANRHSSSPGEGSVYVFVEPPTGWKSATQTAELNTNVGEAGDNIGKSVAISGNTVVAGSPTFGNVSQVGGNGAAFVWVEPPTGWTDMHTQSANLTASDGQSGDMLGTSVAISGDAVVAGAPDRTIPNGAGAFDQGAAYVFTEPPSGWANMTQTAELTASDGATNDRLGKSVAIAGDTVVAGAPSHTNPNGSGYTEQGAAYVFGLPATGTVQQTSTVTAPSGGTSGAGLGAAVSLAGTSLVANEIDNGDAYEFPGLAGENGQLVPSDAVAKSYTVPGAVAVDGAAAVLGDYNPYSSANSPIGGGGNAYVYGSGATASRPTVTTGAATGVSTSSASLSATITAGGTDTNYGFKYATSATALTSTLPAVGQFGAGSGATAIAQHAQTLSGLAGGTTYYYEACATNVAATTPVCGSMQSFKTSSTSSHPPPPKRPTGSAGHATVSGTTVSVPVSCTGPGTCSVTVTLSIAETLVGGKVTGVAASAKHKKKTKKTITVGKKSVRIAAGKHETIKVSLNGTGKSLVKKHPKLPVKVLVTLGGKKIKSSTVTFKAKKAKHKK
jgi:hypothetical protein